MLILTIWWLNSFPTPKTKFSCSLSFMMALCFVLHTSTYFFHLFKLFSNAFVLINLNYLNSSLHVFLLDYSWRQVIRIASSSSSQEIRQTACKNLRLNFLQQLSNSSQRVMCELPYSPHRQTRIELPTKWMLIWMTVLKNLCRSFSAKTSKLKSPKPMHCQLSFQNLVRSAWLPPRSLLWRKSYRLRLPQKSYRPKLPRKSYRPKLPFLWRILVFHSRWRPCIPIIAAFEK